MFVEIRTYRLKPGTRQEFLHSMQAAQTLLADAGLKVIAYGLSLVVEDGEESAYLIRAFDSLEQREAQETDFYGSQAWQQGPREGVLSKIESYHTVVFETDDPMAPAR